MRSTKRHFLKRLLRSGLESVQGGAGTEPAQLLLVVGVLRLEAFLRAVFMREFDDDAAVGRKGVQVENRDAVLFLNLVVVGRIHEGECEDALLLEVGLVDAGEALGEDDADVEIARSGRSSM